MKLTIEQIETAIRKFSETQEKYKIQDEYYAGNNPPILATPDKNPNNKVSVPYVRKACNTVTGYMAKVGNITFSDEENEDKLLEINNLNEADITTNEDFVNAIVNGKSYEIHYVDEDGQPRFIAIPANQIIPIYSTHADKNIEAFIYTYSDTNEIYESTTETINYADVYYTDTVERYIAKDSSSYEPNLDDNEEYIYDTFYGQAPIVEFVINKDKKNIFDHVTELIDQHDKVLSSNMANELAKTALSYITTSFSVDNTEKDENGLTDLDKIKDKQIFDNMDSDDFIKFLEKNLDEGFVNMAANRFERLIYEMLQIPNFNDPTFGTAESGIAIQYKLIDFENLCSSLEAYFLKGLNKRYELINKILGTSTNPIVLDVNVTFRRNLPFDIENLALTIEKLKEVLSTETILRMFPKSIIPDVLAELERIEEQRKSDIEALTGLEAEPNEDEDDDEQ